MNEVKAESPQNVKHLAESDSTEGKWTIFIRCAVLALVFGFKGWSDFQKSEQERVNKAHARALTRLLTPAEQSGMTGSALSTKTLEIER